MVHAVVTGAFMSLQMIGCTGDACSDWALGEKPSLEAKYGEQ